MAASRVIVVTGANRGIGLEIAKTLAGKRPETTVVAACRNEKSSAAAKASLPGSVVHVQIDCGDSRSTGRAAEALRGVGVSAIDVLVNNAGVLHDGWTQAEWDATMETNVRGPIELTQALLPMIRDGGEVVNVSSGWGQLSELGGSPLRQAIEGAQSLDDILRLASPSGFPAEDKEMKNQSVAAPYKVSKALLNRATRIIAADPEVARRGIKVNAVSPGWVRTDMGGAAAELPVAEGAARVLAVVDDTDGHTGSFYSRPKGWTDTHW